LWYLFKLGELVYVPVKSLGVKEYLLKNGIHQRLWRLEILRPRYADLGLPMRGVTKDDDAFAYVSFLDYDGSTYQRMAHDIVIGYFDGGKDIRSLEAYPIRFASGSEAMIEEASDFGRKFTRCIGQQH
jgi:hypothetical protein